MSLLLSCLVVTLKVEPMRTNNWIEWINDINDGIAIAELVSSPISNCTSWSLVRTFTCSATRTFLLTDGFTPSARLLPTHSRETLHPPLCSTPHFWNPICQHQLMLRLPVHRPFLTADGEWNSSSHTLADPELYKQTFALRLTLFIGFGINVIVTNTAFHKKNATPLGKHCGVMVMDGWKVLEGSRVQLLSHMVPFRFA